MKKKGFITILITLLLFASIAGFILLKSSFGVYKKIDFMKSKSEPYATKILYEYVLKENNKTPKELEEFANITKDSICAIEVDLNDDGEKEIVGYVSSSYYWGTAGYSLFILERHGNYYENIAYLVNFEPQKEFYILNSKSISTRQRRRKNC